MNSAFKNIIRSTNCVLLAFIFCFHINADDTNKSANSPVELTWIPSFDLGHITLSVTNQSNRVIKITPNIYYLYSNSYPSFEILRVPHNPDVASISIYFIGPTKNIVIGPGPNGQGPRPIEITPGQKKDIKLAVDTNLILTAKNSSEAMLQLTLGDEVLKSIVTKNLNSLLKEK